MIITRTPFRVSFFGGGTDYPAWYRENGGAVLATSIDKYCYITCRRLPPFFDHKHRIVYSIIENVSDASEIRHPAVRGVFQWLGIKSGLEIHHDGDLPARSGLGSSSSFSVGLIHAVRALDGKISDKAQLARDAIYLEQVFIGEAVGSQDQVSAAYGGFNKIEFLPDDSFSVAPVITSTQRKKLLNSHLMLFFTGISRIAAEVAQTKIENLANRRAELNRMREMVDQGASILCDPSQAIEDFGRLLDLAWKYKRGLSSKVSSAAIDEIYEAAMKEGALGGKLLGAGGGGFLLLFVPPEYQDRVKERLSLLVHVPFCFEDDGSKVVLYQPHGL